MRRPSAMASFAGPVTDRREYQVVYPEDAFLAGSRIHHVRELDGSRSLCGHACSWLDGWSVNEDWHPEDVDADERCQRCYAALESRKRRIRGERAPQRKAARRKVCLTMKRQPSAEDVRRLVKRRDDEAAQRNREIADAIRVANDAGV